MDTGLTRTRRAASAIGIVVSVVVGLGVWFLDTRPAVQIVVCATGLASLALDLYAYRQLTELVRDDQDRRAIEGSRRG